LLPDNVRHRTTGREAADRVAINAIVVEAADATADRVAVNATIVNVAAHAVTGWVAAISDEAEHGA